MEVFWICSAKVLEFLTAANAYAVVTFRVVTLPDWNWVTPVAIAAYCPVTAACKPLTEAAFLDVAWLPLDLAVCLEKCVVVVCNLYEPRSDTAVNER